MTFRARGPLVAFVAVGGILLASGAALVDAQQATSTKSAVKRTAWGDPDFQGMWTNNTATPFERPGNLAAKERLTPTELAEIQERDQKRAAQNSASAVSESSPTNDASVARTLTLVTGCTSPNRNSSSARR